MDYQIYTKKQISKKIIFPTEKEINKSFESGIQTGTIDLTKLREVRFLPIISDIPEINMIELNEKGQTSFTIIETSTVVLTNNKKD